VTLRVAAGTIVAMPPITIRHARALADLTAVSQLQARIWQSQDMAAPASLLRAIGDSGGIILLAARGVEPVGFCFGFTGRTAAGVDYHRSHAAGVVPSAQGLGIGRRLKRAQRRAALALGLTRMVWTFDPVQVRNAHFNLRRLGGIARGYHRDYYGPRVDAFNGGLPSDRLVVEWFLGESAPAELVALRRAAAGGAAAQIAVPVGLRQLATADPPAARRAHRRLRRELRVALDRGLAVVDFDAERSAYRLAPLPASGLPAPP